MNGELGARIFIAAILFGSALSANEASAANTPCIFAGTIETCTDNQADGVIAAPGVTVLNVNSLNQAIAPPVGANGIFFDSVSGGSITINSDTGSFGITATGVGQGIFAESINLANTSNVTSGALKITSWGDISGIVGINAQTEAAGTGSNVVKSGAINIASTGNITGLIGINAESEAGGGANSVITGAITIASHGDISGIVAISAFSFADNDAGRATAGAIRVTSTGDLSGSNSGIAVESVAAVDAGSGKAISGPVTVISTGNVTAGNFGITIRTEADADSGSESAFGGPIIVTSKGDISAAFAAIDVETQTQSVANKATSGSITISSTGDLSGGTAGIFVLNQAGSGTSSATTGEISVTSNGNVSGGFAGIFAGSGLTGSGIGTPGPITVTTTGNVTGGTGIVVLSAGFSAGGDETVNVRSGQVTGDLAAVEFDFGATNTLNNFGSISNINGIDFFAVVGDDGNETINNRGAITGDIDLGNGVNAFNNMAGGLFNAGSFVNAGTFTNAGTISPGGTNSVFSTSFVTGNFVQTGTGTYSTDVDLAAGAADRIDVTAGSANLAGTVLVTVDSLKAGPQSFTILSAAGGVTPSGLALLASPALNAALSYDANNVYLSTALNFAAPGLNPNQTAIAQNLETAFLNGSGGLAPALLALANTPGTTAYQHALDELSPEIYNLARIEALYGASQFSNDMLSCRVAGEEGAAFIREGQCVWARGRARFLDLDHTTKDIGASETTGSFSAGGQIALAHDWRLGFAAGYDRIDLDASTGASSNGDRANVGGILKYNPGPLLLAAGVTAGWGSYDTTRPMSFGGFAASATSHDDVDYISGQLHAAYLIDEGRWYLKPLVDAAVTDLRFAGAIEQNGGGAGLFVPGRSDSVVSVSPALEIGSEMRFDNVSIWRPFVRAGVTWQDTDHLLLDAGFLDAPAGIAPFAISTKIDDVLADISAGFDVINTSGAVMRVQYDGRFADNTHQNSVSFKGSVPY